MGAKQALNRAQILKDYLDEARRYVKNAANQLEQSYESNGSAYKNKLQELNQLKKSIRQEISEVESLESTIEAIKAQIEAEKRAKAEAEAKAQAEAAAIALAEKQKKNIL